MVLSLSKDFDSDHLRSPLRASLESLDFTRDPEQVEGQGVKHRVETCMKANSFLTGADSRIPRIRE
jgi:hypothetical protein